MERLKRKVENEFGFKIKTVVLIKHLKNSSFVAQVVTEEGKKYALKSLFITPERQLFIAKSEQMLARKGVNLARPIPTLKGDLFMIYDRAPYVLYQWIDGKSPQLRNRNDLESIVQVMARFHFASHDLGYSSDVKIYAHPHWEKEYEQRTKSIKRWFNAHKASQKRKYAIINHHIPFFGRIAKAALKALRKSRYQDYLDGRVSTKSLVHGDLHHKNLINQKDKGILIDFEDIRYDLPSKDLLRIFSMFTKNHAFKGKIFHGMMKTYERHNPLSPEVRHLVYIDFLFPHIFERMLRKKKYVKMSSKQLKDWIKQEKKKAAYVYNHYFKNNRKDGGR